MQYLQWELSTVGAVAQHWMLVHCIQCCATEHLCSDKHNKKPMLHFETSESSFYYNAAISFPSSQYNLICINKPACQVNVSVLSVITLIVEVKLHLWLSVDECSWAGFFNPWWMWLEWASNWVCNLKISMSVLIIKPTRCTYFSNLF